MEFNGFEVFPVGRANLNVEDNVLRVSEVSNSGLDGVLIKVEDVERYVINFDTLQTISENDGVLRITSLVKNPFGQVIPFFESFKWYNRESDKVIFGLNAKLMPPNYRVFGILEGEEVFNFDNTEIESPDPNFPNSFGSPTVEAAWGWVIPVVTALIAAGAAVYSALHTKKTKTLVVNYNSKHEITGYTFTVTEDPVPFEVEVNGTPYLVNEVGYKYEVDFPEELIGKRSMEFKSVAEEITGYNLSSFTITSIES